MARYTLADAVAVSVSSSNTATVTYRLGSANRACVYTYVDRVGTVQIQSLDAGGTWRNNGSTDSTVVNTLHTMLLDMPHSQIRVVFTEGGVGAATLSQWVEAVE